MFFCEIYPWLRHSATSQDIVSVLTAHMWINLESWKQKTCSEPVKFASVSPVNGLSPSPRRAIPRRAPRGARRGRGESACLGDKNEDAMVSVYIANWKTHRKVMV